MDKATTIADALKNLEDKTGKKVTEMKQVDLQFQLPPIDKMDNRLAVLTKCEKLSLSTNMIEKIAGIGSLKNLKILSLGRNNIKSLAGIEILGETLEELWISYNLIEKIKPIESMKNLKILFISYNLIKDWVEFNRLSLLPNLKELLFLGNTLMENIDETFYKSEVMRKLPNLAKLDGEPVLRI